MKAKLFVWLMTTLVMMSCSDKKDMGTKAPIRVKTETIGMADITPAVTYVGTVEEREATAVSFTGMGVVRRVLVSEGQAVGRGQLLAEMDDTQARSLVQAAEAQMAQAEDALQRYGQLHDAGSLPEVQWVEIQSKVAQARSSLAVAKKNLQDCRLIAPVSGIIGRKLVGAGETTMPSQAVVTILDISSVKVKVAIPESEIGSISEHTPSNIKVEAAGVELTGGRIEKGVVADVLTHTYDIRINVQNSGRRLLPGMVASVSFSLGSEKGKVNSETFAAAPFVPVTSVQKRADGTLFVWTIDNDSTAHRTPVTIGQTVGNRVAVEGGLQQGQQIIVEGYQKLSEGTKVIYAP